MYLFQAHSSIDNKLSKDIYMKKSDAILNALFLGENFKWSARTYNVLKMIQDDLGISQIRSLVLLTPKRILRYRNAGQKTVAEIKDELSRFRLSLTPSDSAAYIEGLEGEIKRLQVENQFLRVKAGVDSQDIGTIQIELNEHTRAILGRPNFACMRIAHQLRKMGHEIPNKAEEEQATVLWWMLNLYLEHGDQWQEEGARILENADNSDKTEKK
jgi:hypothetical protein